MKKRKKKGTSKGVNLFGNNRKKHSFLLVSLILGVVLISLLIFQDNSDLIFANKVSGSPYVGDCIDVVSLDAIELVGYQGGYFELPEDHFYLADYGVGYGYINEKKTLPSLREIEKEINAYVNIALPLCLEEEYSSDSVLNFGETESVTKISKESVFIRSKVPITIIDFDGANVVNRDFSTRINIRLGEFHSVANKIINKETKHPDNIDLSYMEDYEHYTTAVPYHDRGEILYVLTESDNEFPFIFRFVNKLR